MNCVGREESILMLVHGELRGLAKFRVKLHLLSCRHCRDRMDEFVTASQRFAAGLENPGLGAREVVRPSLTSLVVGIIAMVLVGGSLVFLFIRNANSEGCPAPESALTHKSGLEGKKVQVRTNFSNTPCD